MNEHQHHGHAHDGHAHGGHPDDGHVHDHEDEHHLTGAGTSERAFGGPVTVDVGPGAGALIVLLDDDWLNDEIHLRPMTGAGQSTHTGVWVRNTPAGDVIAAAFGTLPTGVYAVLDHDQSTVITTVDVQDGEVAEIDLRRPSGP
jgi:hypothetical protein